jgi:hypothetical protein
MNVRPDFFADGGRTDPPTSSAADKPLALHSSEAQLSNILDVLADKGDEEISRQYFNGISIVNARNKQLRNFQSISCLC